MKRILDDYTLVFPARDVLTRRFEKKMEISAIELKDKLDAGDCPVLLDIREPHELAIASLDNCLHIPLGQVPQRLQELEQYKEKDIVVICRTGSRSASCTQFLISQGFLKALNLTGGLHAWSDDVDPEVMKY